MKKIEVTLPECWASALFNDDESGLNDEDIHALNCFHDSMDEGYSSWNAVEIKGEGYFSNSLEAWEHYECSAGTVCDYIFIITE